MIDTDVERGPFWPAWLKQVTVTDATGKKDIKFIYPLTDVDQRVLFENGVIYKWLKEHGRPIYGEPPLWNDDDFTRQVKIKLGFAKQEDYF